MLETKLYHVVLFLLMLSVSMGGNAITLQNQVNYYDINANTLTDLRFAIRKQGPLKQGKRYSMAVSYHFDWEPKVQLRDQQCEAKKPDLELVAKLTMPRWISQSKADFAEQQSWIMFIAAGQQYHQQMLQIVELNAGQFSAQVDGLTAANCERLAALIDAKGRAALSKTQQQLRSYQRRVHYGLDLGLRLPH